MSVPGYLVVCENLRKWFKKHNYHGKDPFQIDDKLFSIKMPFFHRIRNLLKPLHHLIPKQIFSSFKPIIIPKSIGLILGGNVNLYNLTKNKEAFR